MMISYRIIQVLLISMCISAMLQAQVIRSTASLLYFNDILAHDAFKGMQDSLKESSSCNGCWSNIKFNFLFDGRFSLIADPIHGKEKVVKMFGLKMGLEFHHTFRVGIGFYTQRHPLQSQFVNTYNDTVSYSIGFRYNTVYLEHIIYNDFRWEVSLPLQLGVGDVPVRIHSSILDSITLDTSFTIPVASIGINAHYKLVPWFGVGAGLGFRKILLKDELINKTFSSPFAAFKIKLFIGPLYKCIFKPEEIKSAREDYNRMRRKKFEEKIKRREAKRQP